MVNLKFNHLVKQSVPFSLKPYKAKKDRVHIAMACLNIQNYILADEFFDDTPTYLEYEHGNDVASYYETFKYLFTSSLLPEELIKPYGKTAAQLAIVSQLYSYYGPESEVHDRDDPATMEYDDIDFDIEEIIFLKNYSGKLSESLEKILENHLETLEEHKEELFKNFEGSPLPREMEIPGVPKARL